MELMLSGYVSVTGIKVVLLQSPCICGKRHSASNSPVFCSLNNWDECQNKT